MTSAHSGSQARQYEIWVRGHLGETMRFAFPALRAEQREGDTVLTGVLPDQAALHGVLAGIEDLGLELLEVRRLPSGLTHGAGRMRRPHTVRTIQTASGPPASPGRRDEASGEAGERRTCPGQPGAWPGANPPDRAKRIHPVGDEA